MLTVGFTPHFFSVIRKIRDAREKERVSKQIEKVIASPEIGKPMGYARKGTREVYAGSYRLSYAYLKEENKILFLDFYHKDEQ